MALDSDDIASPQRPFPYGQLPAAIPHDLRQSLQPACSSCWLRRGSLKSPKTRSRSRTMKVNPQNLRVHRTGDPQPAAGRSITRTPRIATLAFALLGALSADKQLVGGRHSYSAYYNVLAVKASTGATTREVCRSCPRTDVAGDEGLHQHQVQGPGHPGQLSASQRGHLSRPANRLMYSGSGPAPGSAGAGAFKGPSTVCVRTAWAASNPRRRHDRPHRPLRQLRDGPLCAPDRFPLRACSRRDTVLPRPGGPGPGRGG